MARSRFISRRSLRFTFRPSPRVVRLLLISLGLALLLGWMASPAIKVHTARARAAAMQQKRDAALRERDQFARRKAWLKSPEGVTALARERGMIAPGEESVNFSPQKPVLATPTVPKPAQDSASTGEIVLAGLLLFGATFLAGLGILLHRRRKARAVQQVGMLTPRSELKRRRRHAHEPVHER